MKRAQAWLAILGATVALAGCGRGSGSTVHTGSDQTQPSILTQAGSSRPALIGSPFGPMVVLERSNAAGGSPVRYSVKSDGKWTDQTLAGTEQLNTVTATGTSQGAVLVGMTCEQVTPEGCLGRGTTASTWWQDAKGGWKAGEALELADVPDLRADPLTTTIDVQQAGAGIVVTVLDANSMTGPSWLVVGPDAEPQPLANQLGSTVCQVGDALLYTAAPEGTKAGTSDPPPDGATVVMTGRPGETGRPLATVDATPDLAHGCTAEGVSLRTKKGLTTVGTDGRATELPSDSLAQADADTVYRDGSHLVIVQGATGTKGQVRVVSTDADHVRTGTLALADAAAPRGLAVEDDSTALALVGRSPVDQQLNQSATYTIETVTLRMAS